METFSALLALCAGNSPVAVEFPSQRLVTRRFDTFFVLPLNNGWVNNREAGDLGRHRAHYDLNCNAVWSWQVHDIESATYCTVYWCMASNLKALRYLFLTKKSIYVWVYLFAIYVLYSCTEEAWSSSNCLDHDQGTMDSRTWFMYCIVWWLVIHLFESV